MASVKLLVSRAGQTADGRSFSQSVGQVVDVPEDEAKRMIEAGQAEAVAKRGRPRQATKPETDVEKR